MAHVSEELNIEFRYMLLRVANSLTLSECKYIAYAEGLPKSLYTSDQESSEEDLKLLTLHKLEAKGRFDPLNPDGLSEILKRMDRVDVTSEVEKYKAEQRFKDAKKMEKEQKKLSKKRSMKKCKGTPSSAETKTTKPEDMDKAEDCLARARTEIVLLIGKEMKALDICAKKVEGYRRGEITFVQVEEAFKKFTEMVQKSGRTMQKALSGSSISSSSTEGSASSPTHCKDDDWYSTVPLPTQETVNFPQESSPESRRRNKPTPLPRKKLPSSPSPRTQLIAHPESEASCRESIASDTSASLPEYEDVDYTGGTGDSGVGSGGSELKDWIENPPVFGGPVPKQSYQSAGEETRYMPLLKGTRDTAPEGYFTARSWGWIDDMKTNP